MKKKLVMLLVTAISMSIFTVNTFACTGIVVGKDMTVDGSIIMGRTEDIGAAYNKNFVVVDAKDNKAGTYFEDLNGFKIEEPKHAYKYTMIPDVEEHGDGIYGEAGMNEKGVAMSATVSAQVNEAVEKYDPLLENGLREAAMLTVVLPRINSAKEGVKVLGDIISKYGAAEGNIVLFADQDEAWYMEILSGHQWAAVKVPNDGYAVIPNCFMLGYIDLSDTENVMASKDIINLPVKNGFLKNEDGKFNLALTYGEVLKDGNRARAWGGKHFFSPSQNIAYDSETFELFTKADKKISLEDVMELQRYRYEDTEYNVNLEENQTKRAIGTENQAECHIFQMTKLLPKEVGGVMWMAMGNAEHSVYLPSYNIITDTEDAYKVQGEEYSVESAYWSFRSLSTIAELNREAYGEGVREFWKAYEKELIANQVQCNNKVKELYKENAEAASSYATELTVGIQKDALGKAKTIFSELMTKIAKDKGKMPKEKFIPSIQIDEEVK